MSPLQEAHRLFEELYRKKIWSKNKFKNHTGFFLQGFFNTRSVWTLEDLSEEQIAELIHHMNNKKQERLIKKELYEARSKIHNAIPPVAEGESSSLVSGDRD